jgi:hypothetical protein
MRLSNDDLDGVLKPASQRMTVAHNTKGTGPDFERGDQPYSKTTLQSTMPLNSR